MFVGEKADNRITLTIRYNSQEILDVISDYTPFALSICPCVFHHSYFEGKSYCKAN